MLITTDNPAGTISISDLELAGVIAHTDVVARLRDVRERTLWIACDNRAAVAWATKGSATSLAARSHLLRFSAIHQRQHRYVARHHYIPGKLNAMADDASRLWNLTDSQLLSHFNSRFPQNVRWQLRTLESATNTYLIGALSRKHANLASLLNDNPLPPLHGVSGRPSVSAWASAPRGHRMSTSSLYCNSSPSAIEQAASPPDASLFDLARWKRPYEQCVRRTSEWGPLTLA